MLVLTRRKDEAIQIGANITVRVVEVRKDGRVRLGIDAPPEVAVWREELVDDTKELPLKRERKEVMPMRA